MGSGLDIFESALLQGIMVLVIGILVAVVENIIHWYEKEKRQ